MLKCQVFFRYFVYPAITLLFNFYINKHCIKKLLIFFIFQNSDIKFDVVTEVVKDIEGIVSRENDEQKIVNLKDSEHSTIVAEKSSEV